MEDGKMQPSIFFSMLNTVVPFFCPQIVFAGRAWSRTFHLSCNQGNEADALGLPSNVNSHTSRPVSSQDIEAQRRGGDHGI